MCTDFCTVQSVRTKRALSYEEEGDIFFEDHSERVMTDDLLARLLTFPNVLVTGHQVRIAF